jgi:DNA-binding beta-propeller fold protein YncE
MKPQLSLDLEEIYDTKLYRPIFSLNFVLKDNSLTKRTTKRCSRIENATFFLLFTFLICFTIIFIAAVAFSNMSLAYAKTQEDYLFSFKWGSLGSGPGQFMRPHDIEFDSVGNIYISDRELNNIQKFTHDGKYLMQWGKKGSGDGEFGTPYSINIDPSDNVYEVDRDNNRIQKFSSNGTFLKKWVSVDPGSNDTFYRPEDMAFDPSGGSIYVADTGNNRIIKFDSDFNLIKIWGSKGSGLGEFNHPHGIGVDSAGNVYVNDLKNARIEKFDKNGQFIKQWGSEGRGDGQFTLPLEHLFVDKSDHVWQVDGEDNPRIQKFDNNGNFITSVGSGPCILPDAIKSDSVKMAEDHECDGKLHLPEHANTDSSGNLYVVDRGNQRIIVFSPR